MSTKERFKIIDCIAEISIAVIAGPETVPPEYDGHDLRDAIKRCAFERGFTAGLAKVMDILIKQSQKG